MDKKTENNGAHRKMNTNITGEPAVFISIQLHGGVRRKDKCEKWSVATAIKMKHQTKKLFIIKLHI